MHADAHSRNLLERVCHPDTGDRVPSTVALFAHPDDETVGASSCLRRLNEAEFVYLTDGAPRDGRDARAAGFATCADYAAARRQELHAALGLAGFRPERIRFLDLPDQEASLHLVTLARVIARVFRETAAEAVLTHPYEGGHPDHDAAAFVVQAACRLLHAGDEAAPVVLEIACYHGGASGFVFGEFLRADREVLTVRLDEEAQQFKRRLIACHRTQRNVLDRIPLHRECFRVAPAYDFEQPPHPGELLYETFPWGMTGERWRELARAALEELARGRVSGLADPPETFTAGGGACCAPPALPMAGVFMQPSCR